MNTRQTDKNATSWYQKYQVLFFVVAIIILTITILVLLNDEDSYNQYSSYNICDVKEYMTIANNLGIDYYLDYSRNLIGLNYRHQANTKTFRAQIEQYSQDKRSVTFDELDNRCHLVDVKHHVLNVNTALLPYIPNNADHVSYHPTEDKAVYCHYLEGKKGGSQCFYISIVNDKLVKDDISDMERVNLQLMVQRYPQSMGMRNKTPAEFKDVHSAVIEWTDKPPNLIYGITLATFADYDDMSFAVENY